MTEILYRYLSNQEILYVEKYALKAKLSYSISFVCELKCCQKLQTFSLTLTSFVHSSCQTWNNTKKLAIVKEIRDTLYCYSCFSRAVSILETCWRDQITIVTLCFVIPLLWDDWTTGCLNLGFNFVKMASLDEINCFAWLVVLEYFMINSKVYSHPQILGWNTL